MGTHDLHEQENITKDKSYLEANLPRYLQEDIEALLLGQKDKNCTYVDCLLDEVNGSINSAFWDDVITEEQVDYLRAKYLGEK